MRGSLALFLSLIVLQSLVEGANFALAPLHLYLFAGGLFIPCAAFRLPMGPGMLACTLAGFACDAASPVPFGTHALMFAAGHALFFRLRDQFPRDEPAVQLWAALGANFAFFVALSCIAAVRSPASLRAWPRLTADLIESQIVLALVGPWFFALQERTLKIAGAS